MRTALICCLFLAACDQKAPRHEVSQVTPTPYNPLTPPTTPSPLPGGTAAPALAARGPVASAAASFGAGGGTTAPGGLGGGAGGGTEEPGAVPDAGLTLRVHGSVASLR